MPFKTADALSIIRPSDDLLVGTPGTGTWTVLLWFNLSRVTGVQTLWYLNNGHALRTNGTQLEFVYGAAADAITTVAANTWYCVAVTKNATTEARYYVDGVYQSNRTASLSNDDTAAAVVGSWNASTDWLNAGTVGPLKAWDRVLTASEIALESQRWQPAFTDSLRLFWPLLRGTTTYGYNEDLSGNNRPPSTSGFFSFGMVSGPPIPWGGPLLSIGSFATPVVTVFVDAPAELGASIGDVVIDGGLTLDTPLIELAFDGGHDGRYTHIIPRTHVRAVSGSFGFKGSLGKYLSDAAKCKLEIVNTDGAYTDGGGLRSGMWCKVRLAGTGEVLFTGRVTELAPGYGASNPLLAVTLETTREDLRIPAQSVLLKDTNTKDAALALLDQTAMQSSGGLFVWDVSVWDGADVWAGSGAAEVRTYGTQWIGLAAAGGYGKADGDMDVLESVGELMKAEDGRALAGRDNKLELYSRQHLDDARELAPAYTLTDDDLIGLDLGLGRRYTNDLTLKWTPTRWAAGATVYTHEPDTPASIKPGEFRDFNVRFKVEGSDRVLAAEGLSITVTQTGPTVSTAWDGGVKATGGTLRVTCPAGGAPAAISKIAITGTALIANDTAEVRLQELLGRTRYGAKTRVLDAPLIDRETEANARAQREFVMWNEPATFAERATLRWGHSAGARAEAVQWMTLPFATALDVQSARMGHHARYLAVGVEWSIEAGGWPVDVALYLEPTLTGGLLRWDTDGRGWDVGRWA